MRIDATGAAGVAVNSDTVDLRVRIADKDLDGAAAASLLDVSVQQTLGEAAHLTLRLAAWDSDAEQLTWVDGAAFKPGNRVEVELGYVDQRKPLFWGEIVGLDLEASTTDRAVLTVSAYDLLHRLGRGQRDARYDKISYAGIVRELARSVYKVAVDAEDDPAADPENEVIYQRGTSDFEFLTRNAERIGYDLFADADGKKLVFRRSRVGEQPSLTLDASQELVQFSASLDAAGQLGGVEVSAFDSDTKQQFKVVLDNPDALDASYGAVPSRSLISNTVLTTQEQAKARARAELQRIRASYLTASGSCFGRTDLRPGLMIAIAGLGARFGGAYYVTSTRHSLSATGGYRTSFKLQGVPR